MDIYLVKLWICEACLLGEGETCNTPGCAFIRRNSLGFPVNKEEYEVLETYEQRD